MSNNNFICIFRNNIDYYKKNNPLEYLDFITTFKVIIDRDNEFMKIFDSVTTRLAADHSVSNFPSLYYKDIRWKCCSLDHLIFRAAERNFTIKNPQPDLISVVLGISLNKNANYLKIRSHNDNRRSETHF